jgi:hypothetical protein
MPVTITGSQPCLSLVLPQTHFSSCTLQVCKDVTTTETSEECEEVCTGGHGGYDWKKMVGKGRKLQTKGATVVVVSKGGHGKSKCAEPCAIL